MIHARKITFKKKKGPLTLRPYKMFPQKVCSSVFMTSRLIRPTAFLKAAAPFEKCIDESFTMASEVRGFLSLKVKRRADVTIRKGLHHDQKLRLVL